MPTVPGGGVAELIVETGRRYSVAITYAHTGGADLVKAMQDAFSKAGWATTASGAIVRVTKAGISGSVTINGSVVTLDLNAG